MKIDKYLEIEFAMIDIVLLNRILYDSIKKGLSPETYTTDEIKYIKELSDCIHKVKRYIEENNINKFDVVINGMED